MRIFAASIVLFLFSLVSTTPAEASQSWNTVPVTPSGTINPALFASCEFRLAIYPVQPGSTDSRFYNLVNVARPGHAQNARLRTAMLPYRELQELPTSLIPVANPPIITSGSPIFLSILPFGNTVGYRTEMVLTGPNRTYILAQSSSTHFLNLEYRCAPAGVVITGTTSSSSSGNYFYYAANFNFDLAVPVGTCVQVRCAFGGGTGFNNIPTAQGNGTPEGCASNPPNDGFGGLAVMCSYNPNSGNMRTCICGYSSPWGPLPGPPPPMVIDIVRVNPEPQTHLGSKTLTFAAP